MAQWRALQLQAFKSGIAAQSGGSVQLPQGSAGPQLVSKSTPKVPDGHYIISMGTVIPALLLTGLNSDLPGHIIGQVSEHVYDTGTGKHILIPQGSRLFGEYDNKVIFGQRRPLIRWQHLVYPDGSTLNLAGMAGVDRSGYSGFKAHVNSHFGPMFTTAVMLSIFSAVAQNADKEKNESTITLSRPTITLSDAVPVGMVMLRMGTTAPSGWHVLDGSKIVTSEVSSEFLSLIGDRTTYPKSNAPTGMVYCVKVRSSQASLLNTLASSGITNTNATIRDHAGRYIGAELAKAIASMASKLFDKQLNRAPTLVVKQGYRFNVMVNKTIYLPEWKE